MKKGLILFILITILLAAGISYAETCTYDAHFDLDGDYIMNSGADCGNDYQYDCDDGNKDVFKDCGNEIDAAIEKQEVKLSWWQRFKAWLRGEESAGSPVTGNSITSIASRLKQKISNSKASEPECNPVTICYNENLKEIHCPLDYDSCCGRYSDCRIVECDTEEASEDTGITSADNKGTGSTIQGCAEEYNACYDNGEAIICKGDFGRCDEAFDNCTCGTGSSTDYETAEPDIDTSQEVECDTGVFVCERQAVMMNGSIADSKVTCKDSFAECSMLYGNCKCGTSELTDFPTERIGAGGNGSVEDNGYWCEHLGKQLPCSRLPENCNLKKNTCDKGNGIMITCEGTINYCNKVYSGTCLCGIEATTSGFMKVSDE